MAIYRLFEQTVFEPEDIARMAAAYERAKAVLGITGSSGDEATLLAKTVIRIAAEGMFEAEEISARAVESVKSYRDSRRS